MKSKICSKCKKRKRVTSFNRNKTTKTGLQSQCRMCTISSTKRYYKKCKNNPVKMNYRRTRDLKYSEKRRNTLEGYLDHIYRKMKTRCTNHNNVNYKHVGALGIRCLFKSAKSFIDYVVNNLKFNTFAKVKGLSLDRIDINGNFAPGNIRFVNRSQITRRHRKMQSKASSKFKGVCRAGKKWVANITVNGKRQYLGRFPDPTDAARAYDAIASEYDTVSNADLGLL